MKRKLARWSVLGISVTACNLLGCAIAADLFNPATLASIGFDPNTFTPSPGSIIIAYTNNLDTPIVFFTIIAKDANNIEADARVLTDQIDPGQTINEVVDCPAGLVSPGQLTDAFARDPAAVIIYDATGGAGTTVNYDNAALISNRDFNCGDVISMNVNPVPGADGGALITINVLPGR